MYTTRNITKTTLSVNTQRPGERIEQKVRRIVTNKEPVKDGAEMIYTDRKDGVIPDYDPRTDRWEHAVEAMDKITASRRAKREAKVVDMKNQTGKPEEKNEAGNPETGGQSTEATK